MRALAAGTFRQRVTLQGLVETLDSYGQPIRGWADIMTVWAEVRFLRGQELLSVNQMVATASHIVTCRWQGASFQPSPTMRFMLQKDGRVFNVLTWDNTEERNRKCVFTCTEVKP